MKDQEVEDARSDLKIQSLIIKFNPSFGLTKLISAATSQRGYPIGPLCLSALYPFGTLFRIHIKMDVYRL